MANPKIDDRLSEQLQRLEAKFEALGQDMSSYLEGLIHADYLTYWDYIHLDTLLSLQSPRTGFPDEKIFIMYHQITELYLNLIIHELKQVQQHEDIAAGEFLKRMKRVNRYFNHLVDSFDIMVDGMDKEQFLNFRMSLLPASGFQSAQYRLIEIRSTDFHLLAKEEGLNPTDSMAKLYEHIYWKKGATELATGKKTLTLRQFEDKYSKEFLELAEAMRSKNIYAMYRSKFVGHEEIVTVLREFDLLSNVLWPLAHYKSAVRYLHRDPDVIAATGGTNWQKYLPPRFQKVQFFPSLWSSAELDEWGKTWVIKTLQSI